MKQLVSTVKTQLVGRQIIQSITSINTGGVPLITIPLGPLSLGDRPAILASAFERYRIARMKVRFRSSCPTTVSGRFTMGIHDDASNGTSTVATMDQILNLRNSVTFTCYKDAVIDYVPVDANRWYYVNSESTSSDQRFTQQATFYMGTPVNLTLPINNAGTFSSTAYNTSPVGEVDIEYHYIFDGATVVAD